MKTALPFILSLFLNPSGAFMPITSSFRTSFAIGNANSNADDAIKEALETSKKYGITSKEARVAWDIVEEINASNNR